MRRWGGGALGRWVFALAILFVAAVQRLGAQAPTALAPLRGSNALPDTTTPPQRRSASAFVHYGKWAALGGSVVFGVMAHSRNQDAEATYQSLRQRCFDSPVSCLTGTDGRYLDAASEELYTETRRLDRQASRLLVGAEVTFVASAVGFVWELMHRKDRTPTIPFEPRVEQTPTATKVGLTFRF